MTHFAHQLRWRPFRPIARVRIQTVVRLVWISVQPLAELKADRRPPRAPGAAAAGGGSPATRRFHPKGYRSQMAADAGRACPAAPPWGRPTCVGRAIRGSGTSMVAPARRPLQPRGAASGVIRALNRRAPRCHRLAFPRHGLIIRHPQAPLRAPHRVTLAHSRVVPRS